MLFSLVNIISRQNFGAKNRNLDLYLPVKSSLHATVQVLVFSALIIAGRALCYTPKQLARRECRNLFLIVEISWYNVSIEPY